MSKRTRVQCGQFLPPGWIKCRWHGGATPGARAKAEVRVLELNMRAGLARLGVEVAEANPIDVLRGQVREWAGNVAFWRHAVQEAQADDNQTGVFGWKVAQLLGKYEQACERSAKFAKMALEGGLDDAELQIIQREGELLAAVLKRFAAEMGIADDPRAPAAMRSALMLVAGLPVIDVEAVDDAVPAPIRAVS